jgi:hypothetical protein
LNAAVVQAVFVEHPAQRGNLNGQIVRFDGDVRPGRVQKCLLGNQFAGPLQEQLQDAPRASADLDPNPVAVCVSTQQATRTRVVPPSLKREGTAGDGHIHALPPPNSDVTASSF